jgi:putative peptidoglycan lipid II flippase
MASKSLIAFSLGLTGFILVKVLAPGFYARKDTRTPAIIGVIAMGVNALAAVSLAFSLGHVGLALATSLAGIVNAALLYIRLVSKTEFQPGDGWPAFLARVSLATLIMSALLAFGVAGDLAWLSHSVPKRILLLGFWVVAGGGVYLGSLYLFGLKVHRFVERP